MYEVHAVSGAVIDANLRDTAADRPNVSEIAQREPSHADIDASPRLPVPEVC